MSWTSTRVLDATGAVRLRGTSSTRTHWKATECLMTSRAQFGTSRLLGGTTWKVQRADLEVLVWLVPVLYAVRAGQHARETRRERR
jgi:hypothetical protein